MKNLKDFYSQEMQKTKNVFLEFPWKEPALYASWLAQTYNFVCHSTRIVTLAGALFPYSRNEFHLSALHHANQEKNHEKLLLMDIQQLGFHLKDIPVCHNSFLMFQNQYYWIQNVNPISVYGYYLFLEGVAAEFGPKVYEILKQNYPEKTLSFIRVHAEEDPDHIHEHLDKLIHLSAEDHQMIIQNLQQSTTIYLNMLREIQQNRKKIITSNAA
jgi:hypothetical protein